LWDEGKEVEEIEEVKENAASIRMDRAML